MWAGIRTGTHIEARAGCGRTEDGHRPQECFAKGWLLLRLRRAADLDIGNSVIGVGLGVHVH